MAGGLDADGGVFKDERVFRFYLEIIHRLEKAFRVRLAALYIINGENSFK